METSEVKRMTVVYLDRVWALNTAIDYLLLLGTARLSGLPLRRGWLLLWAALGGAYAVAVFLPGMTLLGHPLCRLAIGLIMALGAFRRRWRQAALFFLLAGGLAGVVLALGSATRRRRTVADHDRHRREKADRYGTARHRKHAARSCERASGACAGAGSGGDAMAR